MRISRRFSRCAVVGATSVLTAVAMTACSSSSSPNASAAASAAAQSQANANANENDVQVLNSLQLTPQELDSAFASDNKWSAWANPDPSKLLLKQAWDCTQNIIDTSKTTLKPVTNFFRADQLPNDPVAPASTSSSSSSPSNHSGKKGSPSGSPSSSGPTGSTSAPEDGNPAHWVVSTAISYQNADAAKAAVGNMGTIDTSAANCGGPTTKKPIVGGGIGEVAPSWDNSQGIFVYTDTSSGTAISVVAQRRGRYVVLTYTRGSAKDVAGYYDLEPGSDTVPAAAAATTVLGLLTASVVGSTG